MSDLRTQLERVARRAAPADDAFARLVRYRDRRRRTRRLTAGVLAFAVAGAGIGVAVAALGGHSSPRTPIDFPTTAPSPSPSSSGEGSGRVVAYDDPNGWSISYPAPWSLRHFVEDETMRVTFDGVAISNFGAPGGLTDTSFLGSMPRDGIVFELFQLQGGPAYIPQKPDTTFPLSLDGFDRNDVAGPRGPGEADQMDIVANGEPYTIVVWFGAETSDADRRAVADVVSSLRFRDLREGTATGRITNFYVLGADGDYAVGSVRYFDANLPTSAYGKPFPFYLVHTEAGFYALAWPDDLSGGYKDCPVAFDVATRGFSCPNGAVWALDGSVVTNPDPASHPDDPLRVLLVRISLDGHVLVSPNISMSDTDLDLKLTGPRSSP